MITYPLICKMLLLSQALISVVVYLQMMPTIANVSVQGCLRYGDE